MKQDHSSSQGQQIKSLKKLSPDARLLEFVRAASHDIRNPLSTIIGCADLISKDRSKMPSETIDALINEIVSASQQINGILSYMVDLAAQKDQQIIDENGKFVS